MIRFRSKIAAAVVAAGLGMSALALTVPAHASAAATASPARAAAYVPPGINGAVPVSTQLSQMASNSVTPAITTTAYASTGICTGGNPCWRNVSGALDAWARDISGDSNQQFLVTYWGQAPGADNGACSQYNGVGVFTFVSPADGYNFEGAGYYSGGVYYAGGQAANNRYSNWAWNPNGTLINCGDSQNGARFALEYTSLYHQMYTANTGFGTQWAQVHV